MNKGQRILLVKDKWDTYVMEGEPEAAALRLLAERVSEGFWYDDEAQARAKGILDAHNGFLALRFLLQRSNKGFEYEYVEVQHAR